MRLNESGRTVATSELAQGLLRAVRDRRCRAGASTTDRTGTAPERASVAEHTRWFG
jgi:hypothetical protein